MSDTLSFVLPVALGDTGRPGNDLDRMSLLLESFMRCFERNDLGTFLIITRPQDMQTVSACLSSIDAATFVRVVDETAVCPQLADDPQTFHEFPTLNKGWFRQQLLKFGAANHVSSRFYMTLDSDVVFTNPFRPSDVIRGGRSIINTQTVADFKELFTDHMAEASVTVRVDRDARAEQILGVKRTGDWFYGETPVIFSVGLMRGLLAHLENRYQQDWCTYLIGNTPWTEQSLYFAYAEGARLFDIFHIKGGLNSVLRMSDSLWYPAADYRTPRSLDDWTWTAPPSREGVAVVVQSYLGYEPSAVREKLRAFNLVT